MDKLKDLTVTKSMLLPREEMLEIKNKEQKISLGIPSDSSKIEYRVPITPQSVELIVSHGHQVYIEKDAGKAANYSDEEYSNAGAVVVETKQETFQCDIILRVAPFDEDEIDELGNNKVIISNMQYTSHCGATFKKMMEKKITAVAFEHMQNNDGFLPIVDQMSQISGVVSINVASELLSTSRNGKGVLFGDVTGISPAEMVVIGSGTAAEHAIRAALGLGVLVKVFDISIHQLCKLEEKLGQRIFTSVFYPKVLQKALASADVVIGAMPFNKMPCFKVSENLVEQMKDGSVIIDLNISQGGSFETSHCTNLKNPTYEKHGVIHHCVPNLPSLVARTSSISLSNTLTPIILAIGRNGGINNYIKMARGFREGVYLYNGILTDEDISRNLNIPYKDINLLLAVF